MTGLIFVQHLPSVEALAEKLVLLVDALFDEVISALSQLADLVLQPLHAFCLIGQCLLRLCCLLLHESGLLPSLLSPLHLVLLSSLSLVKRPSQPAHLLIQLSNLFVFLVQLLLAPFPLIAGLLAIKPELLNLVVSLLQPVL